MCCFLFKVGQDELDLKAKIGQMWEDLFAEARQVDLSLADVKKSFSVVRYHSADRQWPIITSSSPLYFLHYAER